MSRWLHIKLLHWKALQAIHSCHWTDTATWALLRHSKDKNLHVFKLPGEPRLISLVAIKPLRGKQERVSTLSEPTPNQRKTTAAADPAVWTLTQVNISMLHGGVRHTKDSGTNTSPHRGTSLFHHHHQHICVSAQAENLIPEDIQEAKYMISDDHVSGNPLSSSLRYVGHWRKE